MLGGRGRGREEEGVKEEGEDGARNQGHGV